MLLHSTPTASDDFLAYGAFGKENAELVRLFGRQSGERIAAGAAVFWEGDPAAYVYEVADGVLRTFRVLLDGRRVIIGFAYPGDMLGLALHGRHAHSAEAVTPVRLRRCPRNRFQDAVNRSDDLRRQLLDLLYDDMTAAQDQMVLLARKCAEERVCSFLLSTARRTRQDFRAVPTIELRMTRLDMADYLGLTIETVSRTMTRLAARQVIRLSGRYTVQIRNWCLLAKLAGDEDDADVARLLEAGQA